MLKKIFKNRFLYAFVALILAAVLCLVVAPSQIEAQSATIEIVRVTTDIREGTVITEDMLTIATVGKFGLNSNAITDPAAVIGMAPLVPLDPRDPIYPDLLVSAETYGKGGGIEIGPDESLVSITMSSAAASVAGLAKPGDLVDIYYAHTTSETDPVTGLTREKIVSMYPEELRSMKIYAVMNSNLSSTASTTENGSSRSDPVPAVVTFIATKEQQSILIQLEHSAEDTIHLVLQKGGDAQ